MRLYWAPGTRSLRALWILEEVSAPYERVMVDIRNGGQHTPEFHVVNPMEKIPALELDGAFVAESGAICAFLAERFPEAGLAPPLEAKNRGRYLQWLFFGSTNIEAALVEKFGNVQLPTTAAGWGSFDKVFAVLEEALSTSPYILGESFSAADVMIASNLHFAIDAFKMLEPRPVFAAYLDRCRSRPAFLRAVAIDAHGV